MVATGFTMAAPAAWALELSDLAPLLSGIPSEIFSYTDQGVDPEGRAYVDGVRANVPDFGIVSADRVSIGDLDLTAMMAGDGPTFADLRIDGLRLSRNAYVAAAPWPFQADVVTGDVALTYAVSDGEPASVEGTLDVDLGETLQISGAVSLLEPDWYRDEMGPEDELPSVDRRVLPREISLHISGIAADGEMLATLSEGKWPGLDVSLGLDFALSASETDDSVTLSGAVDSNLGRLRLSAGGLYGRSMHEEFDAGMPRWETFFEYIDWAAASLSYEDTGLVDPLLAIAMASQREPAIVVLAEALEELSRGARELGSDGPSQDLFRTLRRIVLNYGSYAGDRVSVSVRPVAPVSISMLGEIRVDPDNGLHPDDYFELLRLRYSYQSR